MLNGTFLYDEMRESNPAFATMFFIYVIVVHWVLLLNIFIGLIKGNFIEESKNLEKFKGTEGLF